MGLVLEKKKLLHTSNIVLKINEILFPFAFKYPTISFVSITVMYGYFIIWITSNQELYSCISAQQLQS